MPAAHIERRWVRCDPSTDRQLVSLTAHWSPQTRLAEWDGRLDALDFLDPAHIHADLGLHASVDDLLSKPALNAKPDLLEYGNDYLAFIRRHLPFGSAQELIAAYQRELERRRQQQLAPR
jgi:hypothetical protein